MVVDYQILIKGFLFCVSPVNNNEDDSVQLFELIHRGLFFLLSYAVQNIKVLHLLPPIHKYILEVHLHLISVCVSYIL